MYTELTTIIETEYNKEFKKVEVKYWVIANILNGEVIKKVAKSECKGSKIAAIREIEEQKIKEAIEAWKK